MFTYWIMIMIMKWCDYEETNSFQSIVHIWNQSNCIVLYYIITNVQKLSLTFHQHTSSFSCRPLRVTLIFWDNTLNHFTEIELDLLQQWMCWCQTLQANVLGQRYRLLINYRATSRSYGFSRHCNASIWQRRNLTLKYKLLQSLYPTHCEWLM